MKALDLLFFLKKKFSKKKEILYEAEKCGHQTKLKGEIRVFEKLGTIEMPLKRNGFVDYCLECISKMTIKCAWCGNPIMIGDAITLYSPFEKDFQIPEYAVVYNKEPLQLVGCLRLDCATSGADRGGFWLPGENGQGCVHRIPNAYEILLGVKNARAVIVEDLSDPNEKPKIVKS